MKTGTTNSLSPPVKVIFPLPGFSAGTMLQSILTQTLSSFRRNSSFRMPDVLLRLIQGCDATAFQLTFFVPVRNTSTKWLSSPHGVKTGNLPPYMFCFGLSSSYPSVETPQSEVSGSSHRGIGGQSNTGRFLGFIDII